MANITSDNAQPAPYPVPLHPYNPSSLYPVNFRTDQNGWCIPFSEVHSYISPPSQISPSIPPDQSDNVHDFWKGRFAPFPGFSSRPGLLPLTENLNSRISQPVPNEIGTLKPQMRLLPPRSSKAAPYLVKSSSEEEGKPVIQESFELDKYADVFIPQYLKDIQKLPHHLVPLPPLPVFPSLSYLQSFLLPDLIEKDRSSTILSTPPTMDHPALQIETYHTHWTAILAWELDKLAVDKQQIILWKIGIKIVAWDDAEFLLYVPGIRENHPRVEIGDLVHLREVCVREARGTGMAFEARVVVLRKREGYIHIRSSTLGQYIQYVLPKISQSPMGILTPDDVLPLAFNISVMMDARPILVMENAIATMGSALTMDECSHNLARHWLFPEQEDLASPFSIFSVVREFKDQDWIDKGLNSEQRLAASSIALHQSPVPYLISGPPGTGKTRTLVETVLQILRFQPESCILLCAPSNPATDILALRLRLFLQPIEMLRLNDQNRTFREVPNDIIQYCYIENDKFALPPWKTLMKYRVVVCSCLDAGILVAAQCTNSSLMRLETELMDSLHPSRPTEHKAALHWTHLIIDEAAQGLEPELLIPISVVFTHVLVPNQVVEDGMFVPQLVLCGDPQQLGPIVTSDKARNEELDVSLLERLFERPLYADHTQARSPMKPSQLSDPLKFTPFTNLVKNYRSHPAILMPSSALFYDDSLEPCATNGVIRWSGLRNPDLPLVFFGHNYKEECIDERATWYNNDEVEKVVEVIKSLLREGEASSPHLRPADIGVMAPWREQVWKLREQLRNKNLSAVDVGNIEDYQGRESRVIIISCVRSNSRFLKEDQEKGLGLFLEKKRMNVAITRAKELLVVIGNGSVLKRDPYWKAFLQFMLRNQLYVGPNLDLEMDGNYLSRLESNYFRAQESVRNDEERGLIIAGVVARDVLGNG